MSVEIAFFNGSGMLPTPLEAEVRAGISDAVAALGRYVALGRIGIAVHLSEIVAPATGLGGYTYGPDGGFRPVDTSTRRAGSAVMCFVALAVAMWIMRIGMRPRSFEVVR